MAKKFIWFIGLMLLVFDLSAMVPLISSPYARRNPGKIPYSMCTLENFFTGHAALFVGGGLGRDLIMLNCFSAKEKVFSRIPLRLAPTFRVGLGVGFAGGSSINLSVKGLHGKTVGQLLGKYQGLIGNWFALSIANYGIEMQKYKNSHGIVIKGESLIGGLDLNVISYGRLKFDVCRRENCMESFRRDPAVLYARTAYDYTNRTYLFSEGQDSGRRQVSLMTNDKPFRLSEGGSLCWNELNFRNLPLISPDGHTFHLVRTSRGMSDQMVILENQGELALQTLGGTGIFRLAQELMPDPQALSDLVFVEDGKDQEAEGRLPQFVDEQEGDAI